ncbi:glycosyltransferase family 2 protein [bacterium]|nr:glycosyltransferase family 2 protein [bacterium]
MGKAEKPTVPKPQIDFILLCCCTCKRPLMLKNALLSINSLKFPENTRIELLVVDNDEYRSAEGIVKKLEPDLKCSVHYAEEPKRGLAYARNRVLDEAVKLGASHIMFFDDDELFDADCLIQHVELYNTNPEARIVAGLQLNTFAPDCPTYISNSIVFKLKTSRKKGYVQKSCATNNVFLPVSLTRDYNLKFSEEYVFMGGEDGDFFSKASALGFTIVWNPDAIIYEVVSEARANIKYVFKRCYYNGYSSALLKFKNNKNKMKKIKYLLEQIIVIIANGLTILPCLPWFSTSFNALGRCIKAKGKYDGTISGQPIDFYKDIYGE